MTGLTVRKFAAVAEIAFSTVVRLESAKNEIPAGNLETLKKLKKTFENMGIEFIGTPENGAGVRWKLKS
ncbi:transcriptional regulator [Polynucleobacter paneuropaeus]|nr:transcriptional regulator [Polynucleobacter paneuropaeus]QWD06060.1 transcriptional regulator [Polynucleobacter paneuropaeus]